LGEYPRSYAVQQLWSSSNTENSQLWTTPTKLEKDQIVQTQLEMSKSKQKNASLTCANLQNKNKLRKRIRSSKKRDVRKRYISLIAIDGVVLIERETFEKHSCFDRTSTPSFNTFDLSKHHKSIVADAVRFCEHTHAEFSLSDDFNTLAALLRCAQQMK
jgi:hypothetical protein